jgi:chromosome segregation protein
MRRERLEEERRQLGRPDDARLAHLQTELGDAQGLLEASLARGEEAEQRSQTLQEQREQAAQARSQAAGELQRSEARHHAVQETLASMEADERLDPWLREQGMQSLPRFFARVEIESGWETALEAVLRERVEALEVGRLEGMGGLGRAAPPARVSFFTAAAPAGGGAAAGAAAAPNTRPWRPLLEFTTARPGADTASVQSVLADWLAGTFVQADLDTALAQRGQLAPGEQFVVAGGHLVSRHGLRFFAADDRKSGLLARKREAEHLERQIRAQRLIEEQATETLARLDSQLRQAQQVAGTEREASGRLRTRAHELQIETVRLSETLARIRQRGGQIDDELSELAREEAEHAERRALAEARFGELDEGLGQVQELAEVAREADERAQALLREGRERARVAHAEGQRLAFEVTALRNRQADLAHAMGVAREDAELSAAQVENATLELARLDDSAARSGLEHWLGERVRAEQAVAGARAAVDAALARGRSAEEQRQKIERGLQPRRDRVTELRLQEQASRLASEQHAASLAEAGADIDALRPQLAGAGSPAAQESLIGRLAQEIRDLGAVNLAALQELETARERQGFLQSQSGDLQSAVTTLEDAIRKIDQETRALLQGTFDAINRSFGEMFPRLFGGGEARLTMTGEEILDAGVQVTAQPPGKRNSSIHLLSGGEKALTATALVFALFKLNPAPFCLLDEVDAPLDDANTERFCQLVQSMADATQFLFISHNKIAMEIAEQLIGVTMQEQGVSRIVAVDIDGARRLAADAPTAQAA